MSEETTTEETTVKKTFDAPDKPKDNKKVSVEEKTTVEEKTE